MTESGEQPAEATRIKKLPLLASIVALVGLADAVYLTVHHLTAVPVPCSMISGCETVLTSVYAEFYGIPIASFGALAYFAAFAFAILAAYGNSFTWMLFGILAVIMAAITCWLLYLQAVVLNAFCQYCLISAATSFTLLLLFIVSKLTGRK